MYKGSLFEKLPSNDQIPKWSILTIRYWILEKSWWYFLENWRKKLHFSYSQLLLRNFVLSSKISEKVVKEWSLDLHIKTKIGRAIPVLTLDWSDDMMMFNMLNMSWFLCHWKKGVKFHCSWIPWNLSFPYILFHEKKKILILAGNAWNSWDIY